MTAIPTNPTIALPPELAAYAARYRCDDPAYGVPLTVTAVLSPESPVVVYDPIALDGLLAAAVVREAFAAGLVPVPVSPETSLPLPLPLRALWRDGGGRPLWAAGVLLPDGEATRDTAYRHKRAISGSWSRADGRSGRLNVAANAGRHMERRDPLPTLVARSLSAAAVGDPAEVARLLGAITHLGHRRGSGLGAVLSWRVWPADDWRLIAPSDDGAGRLVRAVPEAAAAELGLRMAEPPTPGVGWTSPYWAPWNVTIGWRSRTPGECGRSWR